MQIRIIEKTETKIVLVSNDNIFVLSRDAAKNLSVKALEEEENAEALIGEPLHSLKEGEVGKIISISSRIRGQERRRLLDMGILPSTKVQLDLTSPLNNPKAVCRQGGSDCLAG